MLRAAFLLCSKGKLKHALRRRNSHLDHDLGRPKHRFVPALGCRKIHPHQALDRRRNRLHPALERRIIHLHQSLERNMGRRKWDRQRARVFQSKHSSAVRGHRPYAHPLPRGLDTVRTRLRVFVIVVGTPCVLPPLNNFRLEQPAALKIPLPPRGSPSSRGSGCHARRPLTIEWFLPGATRSR